MLRHQHHCWQLISLVHWESLEQSVMLCTWPVRHHSRENDTMKRAKVKIKIYSAQQNWRPDHLAKAHGLDLFWQAIESIQKSMTTYHMTMSSAAFTLTSMRWLRRLTSLVNGNWFCVEICIQLQSGQVYENWDDKVMDETLTRNVSLQLERSIGGRNGITEPQHDIFAITIIYLNHYNRWQYR